MPYADLSSMFIFPEAVTVEPPASIPYLPTLEMLTSPFFAIIVPSLRKSIPPTLVALLVMLMSPP